jgi:hypothetical protein
MYLTATRTGAKTMRKESKEIVSAFLERKARRGKRTTTDGEEILLFGNRIAWWAGNQIAVTLAGHGTVTTRDRLNTLFRVAGIDAGVFQRDHSQYIAIGDETFPFGEREIYYFQP